EPGTAHVHERSGGGEDEREALVPRVRGEHGYEPRLAKPYVEPRRQALDHHGARVVARRRVLGSGVAEPRDQPGLHVRAGPVRTRWTRARRPPRPPRLRP